MLLLPLPPLLLLLLIKVGMKGFASTAALPAEEKLKNQLQQTIRCAALSVFTSLELFSVVTE